MISFMALYMETAPMSIEVLLRQTQGQTRRGTCLALRFQTGSWMLIKDFNLIVYIFLTRP